VEPALVRVLALQVRHHRGRWSDGKTCARLFKVQVLVRVNSSVMCPAGLGSDTSLVPSQATSWSMYW
jgi:hypothetical protein